MSSTRRTPEHRKSAKNLLSGGEAAEAVAGEAAEAVAGEAAGAVAGEAADGRLAPLKQL